MKKGQPNSPAYLKFLSERQLSLSMPSPPCYASNHLDQSFREDTLFLGLPFPAPFSAPAPLVGYNSQFQTPLLQLHVGTRRIWRHCDTLDIVVALC